MHIQTYSFDTPLPTYTHSYTHRKQTDKHTETWIHTLTGKHIYTQKCTQVLNTHKRVHIDWTKQKYEDLDKQQFILMIVLFSILFKYCSSPWFITNTNHAILKWGEFGSLNTVWRAHVFHFAILFTSIMQTWRIDGIH